MLKNALKTLDKKFKVEVFSWDLYISKSNFFYLKIIKNFHF